MTKWKMLGSVFNIVNFPRNFTTCGFLFFFPYKDIFLLRLLQFTRVLHLISSNWQIYDGASLQVLL